MAVLLLAVVFDCSEAKPTATLLVPVVFEYNASLPTAALPAPVVFKYNDLVRLGSEKAVKDAGLAKLQGKDYVVQDGDCIYFHFNV